MHRLAAIAVLLFYPSLALAAEVTPPRTLKLGSTAPKLDFRLLDDSAAPSWAALKGQVVIVDFWATWCAPCVEAIPHLDALKKAFANEPVQFFSVSYEPKGKIAAFLEKHPMATTVGTDNDLATFHSFIAWGIPMTYVIDRTGKVAAVVSPSKLTADHIRAALAGKRPVVEQHPGWKDPAGAAKYFREQMMEDRKKYGE